MPQGKLDDTVITVQKQEADDMQVLMGGDGQFCCHDQNRKRRKSIQREKESKEYPEKS